MLYKIKNICLSIYVYGNTKQPVCVISSLLAIFSSKLIYQIMFKQILGPSPALYMARKVGSKVFIRGGADNLRQDVKNSVLATYYTDEELFDEAIEKAAGNGGENIPRISNKEVREMFKERAKKKYSADQKLVKSVLDKIQESRDISPSSLKNLKDMYTLRRKFRYYLRIKRLIPVCIVGPYTNTEMSRMAYAATLGSKSVSLTLNGIIGLSLPAFFFFHMAYYYAPDKLKPICQLGKYTLGGPLWAVSTITDGLLSRGEEKFLGEEVPIDITGTGGTIPSDMGTDEQFKEFLKELQDMRAEFSHKTF